MKKFTQTTRRGFLQFASFGLVLPFAANVYSSEHEEEWRFGIIPDTQWGHELKAPFHGTAIHIIDAINIEMIRQNVDFVIQVGDLVETPSAVAFQTRADRNKSLLNAGIKFYPLRGNHDSFVYPMPDDRYNFKPDFITQYKTAFPNLPGTKGNNGNSPNLPNADGMTYSFTHKNGKFILLDTFPLVNNGTDKGKAYTVGDYLSWINSQLSKPDHQFAIVFAHKNLLGQNHKDNLFSDDETNQDSFPEIQNEFFKCLQNNNVKYFICGHDHMYHRSQIKSPNKNAELQQIICGSAAHKFYLPEPPFLERETTIVKELNRVGFMIASVNNNQIKLTYHSTESFGKSPATPKWETHDSCGYEFKKR
ncbi:MAG: metallophosphoesterase [Planctomycetaceae bacterium]|jgi:3',5'-cyclic AMP phosphodiesterase CpdA|nr:metallophosphoesterase [Planctomycetaceae bacterium]